MTETPGSRGFEQGQIGCGQESKESQNKARERPSCQWQALRHMHTLLNNFLFRAILSYSMLCHAIPFHSIIAFYYNYEILIALTGKVSNLTGYDFKNSSL